MFAAIYVPNFHLTAQLRHRPELEGKPVVLLDSSGQAAKTRKQRGKARILQRTEAAAARNVELGMTAVQGQARCAELLLLNHSPEDEAHAQSDLLDCAGAFTPDFEATADGVATLDVLGIAQAPNKLGQNLIDWLAGTELPAQVGFAANPDLALLAAKSADPITIVRDAKTEVRNFLEPLPISVLAEVAAIQGSVKTSREPDREAGQLSYEILDSWGIQTLGDFTRLPRHQVTERLGPEAGVLWDHASGTRRRLLKLVRPTVDFAQSAELEYEVTSLEPLLFLLRRMLEKIVARLTASYLVAERLFLTLKFDDGGWYERSFRVPDPCANLELLFGMLQSHLDDFVASAPITAVSLDASPTQVGKHQFHLFESSLRDPNRFADTLARLEALLGAGNVGTPELLPSHRADAFRLTEFREDRQEPSPKARAPLPTPFLGLPLRRFRPPQSITVELDPAKRPRAIASSTIRGTVTQSRGPWLGSGDWWDRFPWVRQDWDIQLENGVLYRLFREGDAWKLDGVYG